jgi:hypothetical protein
MGILYASKRARFAPCRGCCIAVCGASGTQLVRSALQRLLGLAVSPGVHITTGACTAVSPAAATSAVHTAHITLPAEAYRTPAVTHIRACCAVLSLRHTQLAHRLEGQELQRTPSLSAPRQQRRQRKSVHAAHSVVPREEHTYGWVCRATR